MHPHWKLPTVLEQVWEQTGSCSYMHSSMSRQLPEENIYSLIENSVWINWTSRLWKHGDFFYLYLSSANRNPKGQAQPGWPSWVVMHSFSHLSFFVHFLFVGQFSSSSPFGQSFMPSQTCFLFTQFRNALLSVSMDSWNWHMYWSSSQNTLQFVSSSPFVQSRTPSQIQVFCNVDFNVTKNILNKENILKLSLV